MSKKTAGIFSNNSTFSCDLMQYYKKRPNHLKLVDKVTERFLCSNFLSRNKHSFSMKYSDL